VGAVNVHPGDLTITDSRGQRLLRGHQAVEDAIAAGHDQVRSSTLWVDQGIDSGPLLLLSDPMPLKLPWPLAEATPEQIGQLAGQRQEELKQWGDWRIFPLTVQLIAQGRLTVREAVACLDGRPYPQGITLEQL
jgi:folate-dependent phosphoribosylglycinamide formyltransferase PurN